MKTTTLMQISLLSIATSCAFTIPAYADNAIFKTSNDQKQWVGKVAPVFKLQDQHSKWHELSQYKGKWVVLYFYPKDDSPGCTQEANEFKMLYPQFLKNNAVVFGVSLDDVESHQKFSKKLALNFPILADSKQTLANQLGIVRNLGLVKIAKRETFLVDPNSMIVYHYTSVNTQTHAKQVLTDIQKFSKN